MVIFAEMSKSSFYIVVVHSDIINSDIKKNQKTTTFDHVDFKCNVQRTLSTTCERCWKMLKLYFTSIKIQVLAENLVQPPTPGISLVAPDQGIQHYGLTVDSGGGDQIFRRKPTSPPLQMLMQ